MKEMPYFTANGDKLTAEKEMPGLNVTDKTWGTTDCSVVAASFSAAFYPSQGA